MGAIDVRDYKTIEVWKDVEDEEWNDWRWQIRNRITTAEGLSRVIGISDKDQKNIEQCLKKFRMAITPYYSLLIDPDNPECPIRAQCIPSENELAVKPCSLSDPLGEEKYSPIKSIVHRYPDRVLFLITHKCSMYCRHCTRRRLVGEEDYAIDEGTLENALKYIKGNPNIRDVLLSGGDPFVMSDKYL